MPNFFDVCKDDRGNLDLRVPPNYRAELAEELREGDRRNVRGVSTYAGLLILQERLERVEALCLTNSIPTENVNGAQSQGQVKSLKRRGRADRCPFGWRLDPRDDRKLVPDREEQETIRRAQSFAAAGASLREVCRRLDREGRDRRGKKWVGAHSVLGGILGRNKSI